MVIPLPLLVQKQLNLLPVSFYAENLKQLFEEAKDRFLVPDVFKAESVALLANGRDTASISQPCLLKFASQCEHLGINGSGTSTEGGPRHT